MRPNHEHFQLPVRAGWTVGQFGGFSRFIAHTRPRAWGTNPEKGPNRPTVQQPPTPKRGQSMPKINFENVDAPRPFEPEHGDPVPPGTYVCRVVSVEETTTRHGDEMWRLRFVIEEGPHRGRLLWDNLPFSEAALPRLKLACAALGLDTSGEVDLASGGLLDRSCRLRVVVENHKGRRRNKVPYDGYEPLEEG